MYALDTRPGVVSGIYSPHESKSFNTDFGSRWMYLRESFHHGCSTVVLMFDLSGDNSRNRYTKGS